MDGHVDVITGGCIVFFPARTYHISAEGRADYQPGQRAFFFVRDSYPGYPRGRDLTGFSVFCCRFCFPSD